MKPTRSESIKELAAAMAKAQGAIKDAGKDAVNPHFGNRYATLASTWEACRQALSAHGLSVLQMPYGDGNGGLMLENLLQHASGEWISFAYPVMPAYASAKQQEKGSAITYARRYALMSLVGITPDDDDDGEADRKSHTPQKRPPGRPKPQVAETLCRLDAVTNEEDLQAIVEIANGFPEDVRQALRKPFKARRDELRRQASAKVDKSAASS